MDAHKLIPSPPKVNFVQKRDDRSPLDRRCRRRRRRRRKRQSRVRRARPPNLRRGRVWTCSMTCGQILPAHRSETSAAPRLWDPKSRGRIPSTCRQVPSFTGSERWSERTTTSVSVRRRGTGRIPSTVLLVDLNTKWRRSSRRQRGTHFRAHSPKGQQPARGPWRASVWPTSPWLQDLVI